MFLTIHGYSKLLEIGMWVLGHSLIRSLVRSLVRSHRTLAPELVGQWYVLSNLQDDLNHCALAKRNYGQFHPLMCPISPKPKGNLKIASDGLKWNNNKQLLAIKNRICTISPHFFAS